MECAPGRWSAKHAFHEKGQKTLAIYRYKQGSLLDEVQILSNESGGLRAYLHAREDATPEQLAQVRTSIASLGWKAVPTQLDGRQVLEIRGFKKRPVLEAALRDHGWVVEPPSVELQDNDRRSTQEKLSNGTLKFAGISYLVGDAAFMKYGFSKLAHPSQQDKTSRFFNKMDIGAGVGYALGSLSLMIFGSRDQSQNVIEAASKKVRNYARKEQIAVDDGTTLDNAAFTERSFKERIRHTLAKYPSETLNSIYVGVGALLGMAATYRAVKYHQAGELKNFKDELWDIGLGGVTATSALAGLVIKEKKPDEEGKEKPEGLGKAWAWVQEKPLRATGIGFMAATLLHAKGTYNKWKSNDLLTRNNAIPRGVFVGTNLLSEVLLALSSKGHGTGVKPDSSIDTTVISSTADLINRQPLEKREELIHQFAGYLASPEVLGGQADFHAAELRAQVEALNKNPWAEKNTPPAVAATSSDAVAPAKDVAGQAAATPGTKVMAAQHAAMLVDPAAQSVAVH